CQDFLRPGGIKGVSFTASRGGSRQRMQINRNRLLVTLVLLAVAFAAMPRVTHAASSLPTDAVGGSVTISDPSHPKPLLGPTNGEPDSPSKQTGTSSLRTLNGGVVHGATGARNTDLLRWISAMWAARFLR